MTRTKLVIFDNDGVLVDSEILIKDALVYAYARQNVAITKLWAFQNLQGLSPEDNVKTVAAYSGKEIDGSRIISEYLGHFADLMTQNLKPTPHIQEALDILKEKGILAAVATSGKLSMVQKKFDVTGLEPYFSDHSIIGAEMVKRGKPAPDIFLLAAEKMGVASEFCAVVEDSVAGITGAKAAGMYAIGYVGASHAPFSGDNYADSLKEAGADSIIDDHKDLYDVLP